MATINNNDIYLFNATVIDGEVHYELEGLAEPSGCPSTLDPDMALPEMDPDDDGVTILIARRAKDIEPELYEAASTDPDLAAYLWAKKGDYAEN